VIDQAEASRDALRIAGRAAMGVSGEGVGESLAGVVRRSGVGWYPLLAVGLLAVVDSFQLFAYVTLGPEISQTLGISRTAVTLILVLDQLAIVLASFVVAGLAQRVPRRGLIASSTGIAWSVLTLFAGLVTSIWQLAAVLVADGASTGSVHAVHKPLLLDTYPSSVRVRVLSVYQVAVIGGSIASPALVALLTGPADLTWRGVFLAMGAISVVASLLTVRLRDPGFGAQDTARLRQAIHAGAEGDRASSRPLREDPATSLGVMEIVQRLLLIPTVRRALAVAAALGVGLVPLTSYFSFFLQERWGLGATQRALFFATVPVFTAVALIAGSRYGESLYRRDPAKLLRVGAVLLSAAVVTLVAVVAAPTFWIMVLAYGITSALFAAVVPALYTAALSVVAPRMRPHASALLGVFIVAVGGVLGLLVLGSADSRYGPAGSVVAVCFPCAVAALLMRSASRSVNGDMDRLVSEIVEQEELAELDARGVHLPLLNCRRVNFSYDSLQVLFDVDFSVDDGEMVALLGTNGAGKSTLLRVIAGVGLPWSGSVRYRGADVTYLDAERRVRLGITQVPGGRAVFGRMSVVDNMRIFGFSHGRDRGAVDRGIERSLAAFPRLAERRNQAAGTLSGGEQQMLALSKALIVEPRLLCIDELSLGLAPKVVGELLTMVRAVNATGTAVVLVEQSVNVALSLVDRAYFMEKGQVRFEGRAADLLERGDLLRSVFLEGAARGLAGAGAAR
jgi:ABC-type branched-subunit amino acid transport system ATPase component/predicted MFS family arabinose efflux permease